MSLKVTGDHRMKGAAPDVHLLQEEARLRPQTQNHFLSSHIRYFCSVVNKYGFVGSAEHRRGKCEHTVIEVIICQP